MNIIAGLKAAGKALVNGPKAELFSAGGKQVQCTHCENSLFHKRTMYLSDTDPILVRPGFVSTRATALVCANCTKLEWFSDDLTGLPNP